MSAANDLDLYMILVPALMGIISTLTVLATIYKICIQKKQQCKHHLDVLPIQHSDREPDLSGKLTNSMFENTSNVHFVVIDFEKEESNM